MEEEKKNEEEVESEDWSDQSGEEDYGEEEEAGPKKNEADPNNTLLYDIMNLKKDATQEEIKKSYRKLALIKHPDKNPNDKEAAQNFQILQKAYKILSEPKKRERYDQWGDDGTDTFNSTEWMNAYEYYRALHPEITKDDFKSYIKNFKNSDTEKSDLIAFYKQSKGDMRGLLENIIASENEDVPRFIAFYDEQISLGKLT